MRDYKKIYDELLEIFWHDKQKIVDMHQQFSILMEYLEQNKPDKQIIDLLEHLHTEADWQYSDFLDEWVLRGFSVSDEQIEALCSKYAYLEFWEEVFDLMISATDFDRCSLEVYLKIHGEFSISCIIREIFDYYHKTIIPQKALAALTTLEETEKVTDNQTDQKPQLPPELSTPEATGYFEKAIEAELMDCNYKWLKTKVLLACFVKEMSDKLKLGKGYTSDGVPRVNWKIFENLIKLDGYTPDTLKLRGSLNDLQKTGDEPLNINLVNDIFK